MPPGWLPSSTLPSYEQLFDAFEGFIQVLGKTNGRDNGKLLSEALTASSLHSSKSWLRFVLACAKPSGYLELVSGAVKRKTQASGPQEAL